MKRTLSFILVIMTALSLLASCAGGNGDGKTTETAATTVNEAETRAAAYEEAVKNVETVSITFREGSGAIISTDVITAIENEEFTEPKNFIFMIGDGMGYSIVDAYTRLYKDSLYGGKPSLYACPVISYQTTYSADNDITDSAAGGTALSTGFKTSNSTVGKSADDSEEYKTLLELAAEKGKSTGVVVTKSVTDATPADFTAHADQRGDTHDIIGDQLALLQSGALDILLGSGSDDYDSMRVAKTLQAAIDGGVTYTKDWAEAQKASLPVIGLFDDGYLSTEDESLPTVSEMTNYALNTLSADENGFFLMVEGSQIDSGGHDNDFIYETHEMYQFDEAVAVALRFVALNPDTVLIVTADHETGGLYYPYDATAADITDRVEYCTSGHSGVAVPVCAAGYGTEALLGANENVEVGRFVASLLGDGDFGLASEYHTLTDLAADVSFTADSPKYALDIASFGVSLKDVSCARAFHVTVKNNGDGAAPLPLLTVSTAKKTYTLVPHRLYAEPGETLRVAYCLPLEMWGGGRMHNVKEIAFEYGETPTKENDDGTTEPATLWRAPDEINFNLTFGELILSTREDGDR